MFILPVLAALTTFIQTRMMTKMNPMQQQGPMQFMMMIYPVLIFVMSYNFPAALPLYWVYSNIYTIIQNYFLYRNNDKHKLAVANSVKSTDVSSTVKSKSGKASKGAKKSK